MTQLIFGAASALAATWLLIHLFVDGRQIARPLVQATKRPLKRAERFSNLRAPQLALAQTDDEEYETQTRELSL